MGSFTIHSLDQELDRRLSESARERKTSKNNLIKSLLSKALGVPGTEQDSDEYGEFCGLWTEDEVREFQEKWNGSGSVDPGDWD